jgi:hypothetical protein
MLSHLEMQSVKDHYCLREQVHRRMLHAFDKKEEEAFVRLALGVETQYGNFSANEHGLGKRIISSNSISPIFALASDLYRTSRGSAIPQVIYDLNLKWLKISVGSEVAMMLKPQKFWVANVRTIWAGLLIENGFNFTLANEILKIYQDPGAGNYDEGMSSAMDYSKWREIHARLEHHLNSLYTLGVKEAELQNVVPGGLKYLWADAIANALYIDREHSSYT